MTSVGYGDIGPQKPGCNLKSLAVEKHLKEETSGLESSLAVAFQVTYVGLRRASSRDQQSLKRCWNLGLKILAVQGRSTESCPWIVRGT